MIGRWTSSALRAEELLRLVGEGLLGSHWSMVTLALSYRQGGSINTKSAAFCYTLRDAVTGQMHGTFALLGVAKQE